MNKDKLLVSNQVTNMQFVMVCAGVVIGMVGQTVSLPLFISSFGGTTGPYFIVLWSGLNSLVYNFFIIIHNKCY